MVRGNCSNWRIPGLVYAGPGRYLIPHPRALYSHHAACAEQRHTGKSWLKGEERRGQGSGGKRDGQFSY
jgi:hypothetical protein